MYKKINKEKNRIEQAKINLTLKMMSFVSLYAYVKNQHFCLIFKYFAREKHFSNYNIEEVKIFFKIFDCMI